MNLSIVDLAPIRDGGSATGAYANTVDLARRAEGLGYSRFWVAEHHGTADSIASTTPDRPRASSVGPETVADLLEQLTERVGVEAVIVQNLIADRDDVVRSHELLADAVGI